MPWTSLKPKLDLPEAKAVKVSLREGGRDLERPQSVCAAQPNQLVQALTDSSSCPYSADPFLRAALLGKRLRSAAVKD